MFDNVSQKLRDS